MRIPRSLDRLLDRYSEKLRRHLDSKAEEFGRQFSAHIRNELRAIPGVAAVQVGVVHEGRPWLGLGRDIDRPWVILQTHADRKEFLRIAVQAHSSIRRNLPAGLRYRLQVQAPSIDTVPQPPRGLWLQ
jgi:hypothetical protein